jgi:hypothetical protein
VGVGSGVAAGVPGAEGDEEADAPAVSEEVGVLEVERESDSVLEGEFDGVGVPLPLPLPDAV